MADERGDHSIHVGAGANVKNSAIGSRASVRNNYAVPITIAGIAVAIVAGVVSNMIYGWLPQLIKLLTGGKG